MSALKIISEARKEASSIVLFSSITGKDSIVLTDLLSKHFEEVLCVFMYMVPGISFVDKYLNWQQAKYPNCRFIQVPHFVLLQMIRNGELGIKQDKTVRKLNLATLSSEICKKHGIEWSCYGFKKTDSLNRRLMLNTYEYSGLNRNNKKIYPLADWKDKDVLAYIKANKLLPPVKYDAKRSSDIDPKDGAFLYWCKNNYPEDYNKIVAQFPLAEGYLFEYEYQRKI